MESDTLTRSVIAKDPYGILVHGDTSDFSDTQAELLWSSLKMLAHDNPYFRNQIDSGLSLGALRRPVFFSEYADIVSSGHSDFHLRMLVLQILEAAPADELPANELNGLFLNPDAYYAERSLAGNILFPDGKANAAGDEPPFRQLLAENSEDSIRLALDIMEDREFKGVDDTLLVETILAFKAQEESDKSTVAGLLYGVRRTLPSERIADVLDMLADKALPEKDKTRWWADRSVSRAFDFERLPKDLIDRYIDEVERPRAEQLWDWLLILGVNYGGPSHQDTALTNLLLSDHKLRHDIQKAASFTKVDIEKLSWRRYQLREVHPALAVTKDDAKFHLKWIAQSGDPDFKEFWRDMVDALRQDGVVPDDVQEIARPYLHVDPDLEAVLRPLEPREEDIRYREEIEQRWANEGREEQQRCEAARAHFRAHIAGVRAGEFQHIVYPAQVYWRVYSNFEGETGQERLTKDLGEELAAAALEGFENFLQNQPLNIAPRVIAESYANGTMYNAVLPLLAGAAERCRNGSSLTDVPIGKLSACGIAYHQEVETREGDETLFECLTSALRETDGYEEYLRDKGKTIYKAFGASFDLTTTSQMTRGSCGKPSAKSGSLNIQAP